MWKVRQIRLCPQPLYVTRGKFTMWYFGDFSPFRTPEISKKHIPQYQIFSSPYISVDVGGLQYNENRLVFLVCRHSLWWRVFFSSLHLDLEWITENKKIHTLTYNLWNDKNLFAFSHFSDFSDFYSTNHMYLTPSQMLLSTVMFPSVLPSSLLTFSSSGDTCSRVGSVMNNWKPESTYIDIRFVEW